MYKPNTLKNGNKDKLLKSKSFAILIGKKLIIAALVLSMTASFAACSDDTHKPADSIQNNGTVNDNNDNNDSSDNAFSESTSDISNENDNNGEDDNNGIGNENENNAESDELPSDPPSDQPSDQPSDTPDTNDGSNSSRGLAYRIENGCVTITGIGSCTDGDIVIPSEIDGLPVTTIGEQAFMEEYYNSITLPSTITTIERKAFYDTRVNEITIPENVKIIGDYAFYNCYYLEKLHYNAISANDLSYVNKAFYGAGRRASKPLSLTIGAGVERIPARLFEETEIAEVEFAEGSVCREIGEMAIEGVFNSVIIPDSVTSISINSFRSQNLDTLVLGDGITSIPTEFIYTNVKNLIVGNNVSEISKLDHSGNQPIIHNVYGDCNYIGSEENPYLILAGVTDKTKEEYTIHKDTRLIYHNAFYNCSSLKQIVIPEGVDFIGEGAFSYCAALTDVVLEGSARICDNAFGSCEMLTSVTFKAEVSLDAAVFSSCSSLTTVNGSENISAIGGDAFYKCSKLPSITLGKKLDHIGDYAFSNCSSLKSIHIPANVISIGENAFYYAGLEQVYIEPGVSKIASSAFSYCSELKYNEYGNCCYLGNENGKYAILIKAKPMYYGRYLYEIPEDTVMIADKAFVNDGVYFHRISVSEGNQKYCSINDSLYSKDGKTLIYAFTALEETSFTIPDGVEHVGSYAFAYNDTLKSVSLPSSVRTIGDYAFEYCTALETVHSADKVTEIGESAFIYCSSFTDISLDNVTRIGYGAFYNCGKLSNVGKIDKLTVIEDFTFWGCKALKRILIPSGVTELGSSAFYDCTGVEEIIFNATDIKDLSSSNSVFYQVGADAPETKLVIGAEVTRIPSYLFCEQSYGLNIRDIIFEKNSACKSFGRGSFKGCRQIEYIYFAAVAMDDLQSRHDCFTDEFENDHIDIVIGACVEKIPDYLFSYFGNISSIVFEEGSNCQSIGECAFRFTVFESIVIPESVIEIQARAFEYSEVTSITLEATDGWWFATTVNKTSGTELSSEELSDPATAANYLMETYTGFYWHKDSP